MASPSHIPSDPAARSANEQGRRLYAAWVSHRLGVSLQVAYARHTPAVVHEIWVAWARAIDQDMGELIGRALLSDSDDVAPAPPRRAQRPDLRAMIPASNRKQ